MSILPEPETPRAPLALMYHAVRPISRTWDLLERALVVAPEVFARDCGDALQEPRGNRGRTAKLGCAREHNGPRAE